MVKPDIVPVRSRKELKQFIRLPWQIYRDDPAWVPPLLMEQYQLLSRHKNSYFRRADVQLLLALDQNRVVGRISAAVRKDQQGQYTGKHGTFGFFESIDDPQVAQALLAAAEQWARERGREGLRGPYSFTINEQSGILIKGFEHSPMVMMPHNPPYYPALLEAAGYRKLKDLFAWHYLIGEIDPESIRVAEEARSAGRVVVRNLDMKNLEKDMKIVLEVFNAAWAGNWGFVPFSEKEMKKIAKEMKPILDPRIALIAEIDGQPAGIAIALPNINEAIKDLNGRLFPFGIFKLLYRIKFHRIKTARLVLLGVKPEYRKSKLGSALSVLLYVDIHRGGLKAGLEWGELSWTLEDNEKINKGIAKMGGKVYKIYRLYEKSLAS